MGIIGLSKKRVASLTLADIGDRIITKDEFFYMAKMLDAHWRYDYEAAGAGRPGYHALLKSERHSDQFFISRILLEKDNIREIIADQLVRVYRKLNIPMPDCLAGIPDGATELGKDVARIMGVKYIQMEKINGKIHLIDEIQSGQRFLLVEDFCTRATGFTEAVLDIYSQCPKTVFILLELVILNRGGLSAIDVRLNEQIEYAFLIAALVTEKIDDWDPDNGECEPCKYGSEPIKPKASDENWELINTAQL